MNLQVEVNFNQESFLLNKIYWRGLFTKTNGGRKRQQILLLKNCLRFGFIAMYCISVSAISWRISKLVDEFRKID